MIMDTEWIGLVPAAGEGTRLGLPFPKELYPILDNDNKIKPVCQNVIEQLRDCGIQNIVLVISNNKYQIVSHLKDGKSLDCNLIYVYQERRNLTQSNSNSPGLAHAISSAYHVTKDKLVFFGMPDTVVYPKKVFEQGYELLVDSDAILYLFKTNTPHKFGMVRRDVNGKVIQVVDKPSKTDLELMWGYIAWKPVFTRFIQAQIDNQEYDFSAIINNAISEGITVNSIVVNNGKYYDIGTIDDLVRIQKMLGE